MTTTGTPATLPEWITSQRRDRGDCERCGQHPAVTEWAATGELICGGCCGARQAGHALTVLRASLAAAGVTAASPDRLDAEAERLAREERWG
jgi:ribosomal protein L37AE/L43A